MRHHRRPRRFGALTRTALALIVTGAASAGVGTVLVVERPAQAEAATVIPAAPVAPAPVAVQLPATTTAAPMTTIAPPSTKSAPARSTSATPRTRTSSAPATTRKRYTEDQLRERAKSLTTDDIMAGRGSMPDGGLTSGETQLQYLCQQDPSADYC